MSAELGATLVGVSIWQCENYCSCLVTQWARHSLDTQSDAKRLINALAY